LNPSAPFNRLNDQTVHLPDDLEQAVTRTLAEWQGGNSVGRLWRRDSTLWTGADEANWLGWLGIVEEQRQGIEHLKQIAADVRGGFTHAVLLGMGGSSLGAEVFANSFGAQAGYPNLLVLDSANPADIRAIEDAIDIRRTLFIVSSKSGTTLEPNILKDHFFARVEAALGAGKAGPHFIAITDPGSKLESLARAEGFRHICKGRSDIGGRFSVLSDFGLVPAAVMGVDVEALLASAAAMVSACGPDVPSTDNPGVRLGAILGTLAARGRDKVTIFSSPGIADIGAWLEQLLAESTGKLGKGLIPVDGEPLGPPAAYGNDRLFVHLKLAEEPDGAVQEALSRLEQMGHPVVRILLPDRTALGQEFFRWELATAVTGAVMHINPFDQPDVEASKVETRALMQAREGGSPVRAETPLWTDGGVSVFADEANSVALKGKASLAGVLKAHLARLKDGDYCALLAYVARNAPHRDALTEIRALVRDRTHAATCVGFGPRFLHSTGQAYKGGPNTGVFLQITSGHPADLPVPARTYGFGAVTDATAEGDLAVLNARGRRALRLHLGHDVEAGLTVLKRAFQDALAG